MKKTFISLTLVTIFSIVRAQTAQNTGSVQSQTDTISLREVVAQATKPVSQLESDGIITTVSGTPLAGVGTTTDLLGYIPGVINNNGSIEVIGRGQPIIYINGRKLTNMAELDQISAAKVKDVKVITNPGARYSSSTNAVIRITTVRNPGDGFAVDSRTLLGYRDYFYGTEQLSLNYRSSGLDIFGFLEYDYSKTKGNSVMTQNTWSNIHNTNTLSTAKSSRSQLLEGKLGFNYATTTGHSFGAYYQTIYKPERINNDSFSELFIDGAIQQSADIHKYNRDNYYEHLVDGYYSGLWGKWSADIAFDLLWRNNHSDQDVHDVDNMLFKDRSKGRMLAGELNLSRQFWKGLLNIGGSYTNSDRQDAFTSIASIIGNSDNRIKENNLGIYGELVQRLGIFMIQVGLRYEHISSDYYENGILVSEQSRDYNELLPSASVSFRLKKSMFQISYARKYSRPLYSQLSSTIYYNDKYTYETGNPLLESSFSHNLSLNYKWNWLLLMANYKHQTDKIISTCTDFPDNPDVTLLSKDNSIYSLNNFEVIASIMPGMIGKYYYPIFMAGIVSQFYKVDYLNQVINLNNPTAIVRWNNIFMLPENYRLSANISYRSEGDGENIHLKYPSWQIDIAISKTFNSHWDAKLSFNDIFNTAKKSGFILYSGLRDINMTKWNNTRGVELTIGYKFNITKSKYKGKGAGKSEIDRFD